MKIKVCGMKYPDNINEVSQLPIDMIGLIFYEKSPRFIGETDLVNHMDLQPDIELVGVFVNETRQNIIDKISQYKLDIVQLHGKESPEDCYILRKEGVKVIKAFHIEEFEDFNTCVFYSNCCDYFLFDTKTPQYGGAGKKFDWNIISYYKENIPFLLSGGINPDDALLLKEIDHPQFTGIDLNSRFEVSPGLKDFNKLKNFILNFSS